MSDAEDIQPSAVDHQPTQEAQEPSVQHSELIRQKRSDFLNDLHRNLDAFIYCQFSYLYFLDCSFFRLVFRSALQMGLLSPRPPNYPYADHGRPAIVTFCATAAISLLWHVLASAPSAGELTNGYLHGGLLIDFIGERGPISKWRLVFMDVAILFLQLTMLGVVVAKRDHENEIAVAEYLQQNPQRVHLPSSPPLPSTRDLNDEERGEGGLGTEEETDIRSQEDQSLLAPSGDLASTTTRPEYLEAKAFEIYAGELVVANIGIIHEVKRQWTERRVEGPSDSTSGP